MQISPGTQLVWSLSGSEAVNLGMPVIEPDHLYCGLLKFAELSDETIAKLLNDSSDAPEVREERDELQAEFKNLPGSTAEIRHALRKEAEHGSHKLEGNLIHRSDASKKVFEKAIAVAETDDEPVYPTHLLQVLMEDPTPAMKTVLKIEDGIPNWLMGLEEQEPAQDEVNPDAVRRYFSWLQPIEDLAPAKGFSIDKTCQPQLVILAKALNAETTSPLLLICEEGVDVNALIWKAGVDDNNLRVLRADAGKLLNALAELDDPAMTGSAFAKMVHEALQEEPAWLFFEPGESTLIEDLLWQELMPDIQRKTRLIVAVSENLYQKQLKTVPAAEAGFRAIWLHNLSVDHQLGHI